MFGCGFRGEEEGTHPPQGEECEVVVGGLVEEVVLEAGGFERVEEFGRRVGLSHACAHVKRCAAPLRVSRRRADRAPCEDLANKQNPFERVSRARLDEASWDAESLMCLVPR